MTIHQLALAIAVMSCLAVATPVFAGPGGPGGGPGGGPSGVRPSRAFDNDAKSDQGKHEGAKRGNKGGKVRGLNRADQAAGAHGDQGRDKAEAKQSR
jgi:hypothetical protein